MFRFIKKKCFIPSYILSIVLVKTVITSRKNILNIILGIFNIFFDGNGQHPKEK